MVRFWGRHSHDWHEKIRSLVPSECQIVSISGALNPYFPWDQLHRHTESYLKKKGEITTRERDKRLQTLIQKHDTLHVAVAACARFMSPEAVGLLLADELENATSDDTKLPSFLQATVAVHNENPLAVTEAHSQLAQTPIWCSSPGSTSVSQRLETLIKRLIAGVPGNSFEYTHVYRLVQKYSVDLSSRVQVLRDSDLWMNAHAETRWLSRLLGPPAPDCSPGYSEAITFLDKGFPTWKVWAEWKQSDTELAQALQLLPSGLSFPSRYLEYLIKMQMAINTSTSSFVYRRVHAMTLKSSACLAGKVTALKNSGLWLEAQKETV